MQVTQFRCNKHKNDKSENKLDLQTGNSISSIMLLHLSYNNITVRKEAWDKLVRASGESSEVLKRRLTEVPGLFSKIAENAQLSAVELRSIFDSLFGMIVWCICVYG